MNPLNSAQEAAASSRAPRIAVVAGPGSGKTATLVERIRRIAHIDKTSRILKGGTSIGIASKIVALTFTNAGARELSSRLAKLGIQIHYVGTLHGWCFRLLQKYGHLLGYRAGGIGLLTEDNADELLDQVAKELGYKGSRRALWAGIKTSEAQAGAGEFGGVAQEYAFRLKKNNLVDYDAVLVQAHRLLNKPEVSGREGVDHLLVDEAQDSAQIDWALYRAIPAGCLFVVGDPDQSVFGFRGAYPAGFRDFAKCVAIERITLDLNYRSGTSICAAASRLVEHNTGRIPKDVVPSEPRESEVLAIGFTDDRDERKSVRRAVAIETERTPANEIAILCRTNALVEQFRDELEAHGIPTAGRGEKPNLPPDWSAALDVLNLCNDPRNDLLAERVIKRVGPYMLAECRSMVAERSCWMTVAGGTLAGIYIPTLIPPLDYVAAIMARNGISRKSQLLVSERIKLLPEGQTRLVDLLRDLFNHREWTGTGERSQGVTVCTMHAAKGREWDAVFLPAFEARVIPAIRKDTGPEQIEEERRLAFVAMTRARHRLHVSWARTRFAWGKVTQQQPSRFINEALNQGAE